MTFDGDFWRGLAIFLAIVLSPGVLVLIGMGVQELLDRAWLRGYDEAWQRAVDAQNNGMKLI